MNAFCSPKQGTSFTFFFFRFSLLFYTTTDKHVPLNNSPSFAGLAKIPTCIYFRDVISFPTSFHHMTPHLSRFEQAACGKVRADTGSASVFDRELLEDANLTLDIT